MIGYLLSLGDIGSLQVSVLLGLVGHVLELVKNVGQSLKRSRESTCPFRIKGMSCVRALMGINEK